MGHVEACIDQRSSKSAMTDTLSRMRPSSMQSAGGAACLGADMLSSCVLRFLLFLLQLEQAGCWEDAIDEVIRHFELEHQRRATYTICYY
jgi:hypothetical protein